MICLYGQYTSHSYFFSPDELSNGKLHEYKWPSFHCYDAWALDKLKHTHCYINQYRVHSGGKQTEFFTFFTLSIHLIKYIISFKKRLAHNLLCQYTFQFLFMRLPKQNMCQTFVTVAWGEWMNEEMYKKKSDLVWLKEYLYSFCVKCEIFKAWTVTEV